MEKECPNAPMKKSPTISHTNSMMDVEDNPVRRQLFVDDMDEENSYLDMTNEDDMDYDF